MPRPLTPKAPTLPGLFSQAPPAGAAAPAFRRGLNTQEKLEVLAEAGQYDLACACGTKRAGEHRQRGKDQATWLYPVSLPQGGTGIMLKTLLSSNCSGDCGYCPLRASADVMRRCTLGADETARIFMDYQARHRLMGLFLSSAMIRDADNTMERLNAVAAILRKKYRYRGYIHLKVMPGASPAALAQAVALASAVSLNIETPTAEGCDILAPGKDWRNGVLGAMEEVTRLIENLPPGRRVRQTTQFIVGAAAESDRQILARTFDLYKRLALERVYFSAYQKGAGRPDLPGESNPDPHILTREHRLYQGDFLIRQYGFKEADFSFGDGGRLSLARDPKHDWALAHPEFFPVRVRQAERWQLLRVPGLGPVSVERILKARRLASLRNLSDIQLTGQRAVLATSYLDFS